MIELESPLHELVQHFALPDIYCIWFGYIARLRQCGGGIYFTCSNLFLPAFAVFGEKGGGGQRPVTEGSKCSGLSNFSIFDRRLFNLCISFFALPLILGYSQFCSFFDRVQGVEMK